MANCETPKVFPLFDSLTFTCDMNDLFCVFWLNIWDCLFGLADDGLWAVEYDGWDERGGLCLVFNGSELVNAD
jgi:hypothetical protein